MAGRDLEMSAAGAGVRVRTGRLAAAVVTCIAAGLSAVVALAGPTKREAVPPAAKPAAAAAVDPQALEFFEAKVRPLLAANCGACHAGKQRMGGLQLDSRVALLKGGGRGPAVVPGQPDRSLLIQAVGYGGLLRMPPAGKLKHEEIGALADWVKMGAPWPAAGAGAPGPGPAGGPARPAEHWAFRPVRVPSLPNVRNVAWARSPIDRFVLAAQERKGLLPSAPADRRTLIRRAAFDLTGLPPTAEQIATFVNDRSPDAFARVVDDLLASLRFGERWGRYWLDIARYADTKGYVFQEDRLYPFGYTYRDYVIRAFNDDLPYDRFLTQQIAADQLDLGEDRRPLAALGFLTLGRRFLNNQPDIIDDRIDVVCRGTMALTVTCARCHDHKFDPIPTADYYSLYGVFASSTEPKDLPLIAQPERNAAYVAYEQQLRTLQAAVDQFLAGKLDEVVREAREHIADSLLAANDLRSGADARGVAQTYRLRPILLRKWATFLAETGKPDHPIFGPWHRFASLTAAEFSQRAPAIAVEVAADPAGPRRLNSRIAAAFGGKPPVDLPEVARRYAAVLNAPGDDDQLEHALDSIGGPLNIEAKDVEAFLNQGERGKLADLRKPIGALNARSPAAPQRAMVLVDLPRAENGRIFLRGNPNNPGPEVPRQFLGVVAGERRKPFTQGSGRLEMAQAIASAENPLTPRVMANRVWAYLIGKPLVRTPGDFGLRSDPPTHPELLDWLAASFAGVDPARLKAAGGEDLHWSVKRLVRSIMLSATYQQASVDSPRGLAADPENRLVWKMNRKRLDLEALRDSLLFASGRLDLTMGGPSVELTKAPFPVRRTVYGFIDRQNLQGLFRTFDFASPDTTSPQRYSTTVPQQALFMMNSAFVVEQSQALAKRAAGADLPSRVAQLYRLALGRDPDPEEVALAARFIDAAPGPGGGTAIARAPAAVGPAVTGAAAPPTLDAWDRFAQVLLMSNEFAFVD